ncbi:MAG: FIST C-terminal domain-containing protein [Candidatus Omnitrophica bacterium]|nr:FIST C-terminal domain-containing protein [Candidatus Omnitrophota bacterium]
MTTRIGIGFSQEIDAETAAKDAAFLSKTNLDADAIDIAIIFSTIHYNPNESVPVIQTILNHPKVIGCSTAGIILSDSIESRGIAVLTISSDEMKFGAGYVDHLDTRDIQRAGALLARNTLADFGDHSRQAFLSFVDGHLENNSVLLKGIQEVFGNVFCILGAGSCDDFRFADSFQIFHEHVMTSAATGLLIGGHVIVSVGCHHGWRPLGKPRIIDKAEGNIIRTISGNKAFSLYEEYFGDKADDLHSNKFGQMAILYPLGIFIEGSSEYLLRNIVDIRPDGSIVCQGDVPEGKEVHIMISNKELCKQAAIDAAEEAHKGLSGKTAKLIIIFESMARLKLLGRMALEEVEHIEHIFGASVPIIGIYTNGEICPFQTVEKFKKPYLLNETIVVLAIG